MAGSSPQVRRLGLLPLSWRGAGRAVEIGNERLGFLLPDALHVVCVPLPLLSRDTRVSEVT